MKFTSLSFFLLFFLAQSFAPVSLQKWGPSKQTSYTGSATPTADASADIGEIDTDLNKSQLVKPTPVSYFGLLNVKKELSVISSDNTGEFKNFTLSYISRFIISPPSRLS